MDVMSLVRSLATVASLIIEPPMAAVRVESSRENMAASGSASVSSPTLGANRQGRKGAPREYARGGEARGREGGGYVDLVPPARTPRPSAVAAPRPGGDSADPRAAQDARELAGRVMGGAEGGAKGEGVSAGFGPAGRPAMGFVFARNDQ